jgi:siroheme synthase-like protein
MAKPPLIVALSLAARACLVVGSGAEAEFRVLGLIERGARVTLVSSALTPLLAREHARGAFTWKQQPFDESHLTDTWLVVLADSDAELAARIARAAEVRRILYCAIDQPTFGNFAHLAEASASDLRIAISTAGRVPALARRLRQELQRLLDEADFVNFFEHLAAIRQATPPAARRQLLAFRLAGLRFSGKLELPEDD